MRVAPLLLLVGVVLASAGPLGAEDTAGGPKGGPPKGGPPKVPPALVEVAPVTVKPVAAGRSFVGTIEPVRQSVVGSEFAGMVVDLLAREGDRVEENQPLAQLRTQLIDLRIASGQALLEQYKQRLLELQNGSRPEDIKQARARVDQASADLDVKRWKLEAAQRLYEKKTISEDELRDARLAMRAAELTLDADKAALALLEAGPREEQIAQAKAQVAQQDAEVKRLQDEKAHYVIRAPFAGYVTAERTEVGQWLQVGSPVVEIVRLDELDIVVQVVEDFISKVEEGQPARVEVDAVNDRVFTGTVHKIVPFADLKGRTFPVKIRLENVRVGEGVLLKAGMFVQATLGVGEKHPATLVPKDAIVLGGIVPRLIWIVDPQTKTAKMVPVQLGVATGDMIEVIGPVPPDAQVVVKGNERIYFPGQALQIIG